MAARNQLDLVINALIVIRKASSAIDAALGLPAADRARLEENLDAVRQDLNRVIGQIGGAIPGAGALARRPEVKMAAGMVEFVARQSAAQLGVVAGAADALRLGGDSRTLSDAIARHLREVGVASREDIATAVGVDPKSPRMQEALERALGSGKAEWYAPNVYGVPRRDLEDLAAREESAEPAPVAGEATEPEQRDLGVAVGDLESSLEGLGRALAQRGIPNRP